MEEQKKKFPSCFPEDFEEKYLPPGLLERNLAVFRVCTNGIINKETFRSSLEEALSGSRPMRARWKKGRYFPGDLSVSCNDTREGGDNALKCLVGHHPKAFLIQGTASSRFGPLQRTVEREPAYPDESHFDWWLYADSDPSAEFEPVDDGPPDAEEGPEGPAAKEH